MCAEQTDALTQGLPALGESGPKGRKSSYLFSRLAAPTAVEGFQGPVYDEAQRTQSVHVVCVTHPFHRQQVQRVRYGTMATPVNPNHNARRVVAAASRRLRYDNRPSRQVSVSTPAERAAAALVRAACHVEALRVPLCTQCNLAIPDAQHLTFECPAVLPKIREVLRVVNFAASSD